MAFDVSIAMTWILYLALFPMAFFWLRRAWRILVKKDYSEVALKRGEPPKNPKKFAPFVALTNLVAGLVSVWVILGMILWIAFGVGIGFFRYDSWSAVAGVTIWCKIFADFIISRQAHPYQFGRKKKAQN